MTPKPSSITVSKDESHEWFFSVGSAGGRPYVWVLGLSNRGGGGLFQERSKVSFLMVDSAGPEDKPLKIPKEVWLLVNHLFTKSCQQASLHFINHRSKQLQQIGRAHV